MYYYDGSAMAQVMDAVRARAGPIRYAVIGLGAGSLACRAKPRTRCTIMRSIPHRPHRPRPRLFHFLSACRPDVPVMLGDARLTLADAPDGSYDIIYVDAFLGDAIPIHLMTREAMALYLRKLKPHGIVAIHVSNCNLELASVAAGIAAANGATARVYDGGDVEGDANEHIGSARRRNFARSDADFGALAQSQFWPIRKRDPNQRVWTDDYSNIFGAILRRLREKGATDSQ